MSESNDYQRLRSLIVRARFQGFTPEVETAFWRVIDDEHIHVDQPHFEAAFQRHLALNVDLSDRANGEQNGAAPNESLAVWAAAIYQHYENLDSAVAANDVGWFASRLETNTNNPQKNDLILALEAHIRVLNNEIERLKILEVDPTKRLATHYKIILGIAISKFRYSTSKRNSASANIARTLPDDCSVGSETVHKVLLAASDYLAIESP